MYQRIESNDKPPDIMISDEPRGKNVSFETIIPLQKYTMPKSPKPLQPIYSNADLFDIQNPNCISEDISIFACKAIVRNRLDSKLELLTVNDIVEFSGTDYNNEIDSKFYEIGGIYVTESRFIFFNNIH